RSRRIVGPKDLLAAERPRRGASRRLSEVLARARRLETVQQRIRALLPPALARSCHVVGHSDTELRLLVEHQALATQLRFRRAELLEAAGGPSGAPRAAELSIVVRPPPPGPSRSAPRPGQRVPAAAAAELETLADAESDPALRAVLLRLARRSNHDR
ncbi:MAG: DciA family protein, partial [Pseudomonadales bacterium]|nr:DciA family protein [Pseudomonadales bacterium]